MELGLGGVGYPELFGLCGNGRSYYEGRVPLSSKILSETKSFHSKEIVEIAIYFWKLEGGSGASPLLLPQMRLSIQGQLRAAFAKRIKKKLMVEKETNGLEKHK